jgi:hypothetical protein
MRNLRSISNRLAGLLLMTGVLGALGCATETKVVRTPYYTLSHPDFWKVKSVAAKPAEPTVVTIGQYGSSTVTEGSGATEDSMYETSQAEVEVRIYAWPELAGTTEAASPSEQVSQLLFKDPELQLEKHGLVNQQQAECGREFKRKYKVLGTEQAPLDLIARPGWRTILLGGKSQNVLVGVVSRVPYEQDGGLYCHNLNNMRTQLELVLGGLQPASNGGPAPPAPAPSKTPEAP